MKYDGWCIRGPRGAMWIWTFRQTKSECLFKFNLRGRLPAGFKCVKVKLVEAGGPDIKDGAA